MLAEVDLEWKMYTRLQNVMSKKHSFNKNFHRHLYVTYFFKISFDCHS